VCGFVCVCVCVCTLYRICTYYVYCTTTGRAKAGCQRNNNNIIVFAKAIARRRTPESNGSLTLLLATPLPRTHRPICMTYSLIFVLFSRNVIIKTRAVVSVRRLITNDYSYDCCGILRSILLFSAVTIVCRHINLHLLGFYNGSMYITHSKYSF